MKRIVLSLVFLASNAHALTQQEQEKVESLIEEIERGSIRGLDNIWEAIGNLNISADDDTHRKVRALNIAAVVSLIKEKYAVGPNDWFTKKIREGQDKPRKFTKEELEMMGDGKVIRWAGYPDNPPCSPNNQELSARIPLNPQQSPGVVKEANALLNQRLAAIPNYTDVELDRRQRLAESSKQANLDNPCGTSSVQVDILNKELAAIHQERASRVKKQAKIIS